MGSAKGNRPLMANEFRILNSDATPAELTAAQAEHSASIEHLVQQLRFANPSAAVAFLSANPGILGQSLLMSSLTKHTQ